MTIRPSIDEWALSLITEYSKRGTCIRRQAGAMSLDRHNRIVGIGMNGVPKNFQHCTDFPCAGATDLPGDTSNCWAIHAEVNMLVNAVGRLDEITKVYVSTSPCKTCALVLSNLPNLAEVRFFTKYADLRGIEILEMAGVAMIHLP